MQGWGGRCLPLADFLFTLAITVDEADLVWTLTENWCGPGGVAVLLSQGDRLYVGVGAAADCETTDDHSFQLNPVDAEWSPSDHHFRLTPWGQAETMVRSARWIWRREHASLPIEPLPTADTVRDDYRTLPLHDRLDALYRAAESELAGRALNDAGAVQAAQARRTAHAADALARARAVRRRLAAIHSNDRVFGL